MSEPITVNEMPASLVIFLAVLTLIIAISAPTITATFVSALGLGTKLFALGTRAATIITTKVSEVAGVTGINAVGDYLGISNGTVGEVYRVLQGRWNDVVNFVWGFGRRVAEKVG
ncbi:hypothetical protein HDU76_011412 [Blyttiomyces sp. JEL0837]|nr:hypothetical protein HDU76_011412 [Blyttiomyces sp. JEL0837]